MEPQTTNRNNEIALLALLFFYPIGLFLMWTKTNWNKNIKWVITLGFGLLTIISIAKQNEPNIEYSSNKINELKSSITTQEKTSETPQSSSTEPVQKIELEYYKVTNVVDGDTLDVTKNGKTQRIRVIGLDTPETVDPRKPVQCFGKEASNKAKEILLNNEVYLEADSTQDDQDKYSRLLRYVFLKDGTDFGQKMIEEGYGFEYTYEKPYSKQDAYRLAEETAITASKGLWALEACAGLTETEEEIIVTPEPQVIPEKPITNGYTCNCSKTCASLSCSEAQFQLNSCGCSVRDKDGDGIACDSQCQ